MTSPNERIAIVETTVDSLSETQRLHGAEIDELKKSMGNVVTELKSVRLAIYAMVVATLAGPTAGTEATHLIKSILLKILGM